MGEMLKILSSIIFLVFQNSIYHILERGNLIKTFSIKIV